MIKWLCLLVILLAGNLRAQSDTITLVSYNLLNFPDGRNDCGGNFNVPMRYDSLRKILSYAKPDIFVACEIQHEAGADSILTRSLNVFGNTAYQMADFHGNTSGANELQNSMYYNSDKLTFYTQDIIQTDVRDIDHYILYVNDPNLSIHKDTAFVEVYMCHLKAGSGSAEQAQRNQEAQIIRQFIDTRPPGRLHFVCGDMNTYRSTEACYQTFTNGGTYPLHDPINMPGSWNNNSSFAAIHTQSPRTSQSLSCGSTGGLDDRFDHILVSQPVLSGADSLRYIPGSYRTIGNDGNHFNQSLLSGSNSMYPDSVVNALYYTSDHLPVTLKVKYTVPTDFGLGLDYTTDGQICPGENNGSATVTPTLGSAPYTYAWNAAAGNQSTQTATGLSEGYYCVTVTDANGKTDQACVEISASDPLNAGAFATAETSNCNGEATVLVSGGIPPYTYLWNDPQQQDTQTATGLCAGTYVCTVSDANGCATDVSVLIQGVNSLEEQFRHAFTLYPNPVENELSLQMEAVGLEEGLQVTIYDLTGKKIEEHQFTTSETSGKMRIPTQQLNEGVYLIELRSGKYRLTRRFIKTIHK